MQPAKPAELSTLALPVKTEYFEQIRDGSKTTENRLANVYWTKRLHHPDGTPRRFTRVVIMQGYPSKDDTGRRLVFPWRGFERRTITHKHFGPDPVTVFAIKLTE